MFIFSRQECQIDFSPYTCWHVYVLENNRAIRKEIMQMVIDY